MSETIYIKETKEFMMENGHIVKESDLSKEEVEQLKSECSQVSRLFGNSSSDSQVLKG
jgi:ferredoxin-fold anticodon binding domain-containing protein